MTVKISTAAANRLSVAEIRDVCRSGYGEVEGVAIYIDAGYYASLETVRSCAVIVLFTLKDCAVVEAAVSLYSEYADTIAAIAAAGEYSFVSEAVDSHFLECGAAG